MHPFVPTPSSYTLHFHPPLRHYDLRNAEDVRLDLDVALRIADPQRFAVQFAPLDGDLEETSLA